MKNHDILGRFVRLTDKAGAQLSVSRLLDVHDYRDDPSINEGGRRIGSVVVAHDPFMKPLWYGGSYLCHGPTYFTLPSGHENIWGCGNDFDSDALKIHSEDLAEIMRRFFG